MQTTLLITMLAIGAPAPKEAPPKKDFTIVGEWLTERVERDGKDVTSDVSSSEWVFWADGTFRMRVDGTNIDANPWSYTVDLAAKPMTIDVILSNPKVPKSFRGILKYEGDRLIICFARIGKPRPEQFASSFWRSHSLTVFKRVKIKD